jgi:nickel/cobalt transporter (NicO) family protein
MIEILISSLILSLIHAAIPNHWMPIIAISKAEKWTKKQTLSATLITGFSHTLSTVLIGIAIGFAGYKFSEYYSDISHKLSSIILIALGIIYIIIDYYNNKTHTHIDENITKQNKSRIAILISLSIAMFLTPCVEIEAYYLRAGIIGWAGIIIVSAVYVIVTAVTMIILTFIGMKSTEKIRSHFLEHHEKLVTGIVLVILGIFAFIIEN